MNIIRVENLKKSFINKSKIVDVLHGVTFEFPQGKMTAVMGPSGSGKSTFLQCIAGLDKPTSGLVFLKNTNITAMNEKQSNKIRREQIGFVFQSYNLLPMLTVYENIVLPLKLANRAVNKKEVMQIIEQIGLGKLHKRYPAQLSGGQQQRVAIARTLATKPDIVFADEPTGALDTATGRQILLLLREIVDKHNQTVIMVTHDPAVASFADQVIFLVDGKICNVLQNPSVNEIASEVNKWEAK